MKKDLDLEAAERSTEVAKQQAYMLLARAKQAEAERDASVRAWESAGMQGRDAHSAMLALLARAEKAEAERAALGAELGALREAVSAVRGGCTEINTYALDAHEGRARHVATCSDCAADRRLDAALAAPAGTAWLAARLAEEREGASVEAYADGVQSGRAAMARDVAALAAAWRSPKPTKGARAAVLALAARIRALGEPKL